MPDTPTAPFPPVTYEKDRVKPEDKNVTRAFGAVSPVFITFAGVKMFRAAVTANADSLHARARETPEDTTRLLLALVTRGEKDLAVQALETLRARSAQTASQLGRTETFIDVVAKLDRAQQAQVMAMDYVAVFMFRHENRHWQTARIVNAFTPEEKTRLRAAAGAAETLDLPRHRFLFETLDAVATPPPKKQGAA